jgi:hypothetical protein
MRNRIFKSDIHFPVYVNQRPRQNISEKFPNYYEMTKEKINNSRCTCGPGSSVGIATGYGLDGPGIESQWGRDFRACPDRPWGPPSLLYNGYRVFPRGKLRPGRAADHSPPF